jgi:hypothetical protein
MENFMNRFVSFLLLIGLSATAAAQGTAGSPGLSYTYAEIGYGQVSFDSPDVDGDGFGIAGSYALTDQFFLFAGYSTADLDFDVDATDLNVGFGFNTPITETIDVVATLSYVYVEFEQATFGSADDNGLGGSIGLRALMTPQIELFGGVEYVDLSDSGGDTALAAGARYNFNEKFAVGFAGSWSDDASSYTLTGRMYF